MPMAIIAAAIGGIATIGGAAISANAANHASDVAQQAAQDNNALQRQTYAENKALEQPYITAGTTANDALQSFLGLGGDPAKTQAAFNNYLNSTGYQFTRNQGLEAVTQSKAVNGLLNSGSAIKGLDAYGTGLADQYGQQYIDNLGGLANRGASSANALAGLGQTSANQQQSNNNSAATVSANAGLSSANSINNLIGNAFTAYGLARGQSSYLGGSGGSINAFNPSPLIAPQVGG